MTASHTVLSPQPALRDPTLVNISAPGIYPGETVVTLDTGELVAVFVNAAPKDNNAGCEFYASARVVNADGSTKMAGEVQLVTETTHSASHDELTEKGATLLAQACLAGILGEPIPTFDQPADGDVPGETIPAIGWSGSALNDMSIRAMLAVKTASSAINAGSLLG